MVALSTLQISSLSIIPNRFYESLKLKIECVTMPNAVTYFHEMIF